MKIIKIENNKLGKKTKIKISKNLTEKKQQNKI